MPVLSDCDRGAGIFLLTIPKPPAYAVCMDCNEKDICRGALMEAKCGECIFYQLRTNIDGICVRFPPVPYPAPQKKVITGEVQMGVMSMRPLVGYHDCCGEFIPRPKEEATQPSEN